MTSRAVPPLDGIRVVDLSRYLSGPTATMLLADMGADVVKVETLPNGDPARESGPFQGAESVYYMASNRNKKSLAVDLRDPRGRDIVHRLVARADVFVQNFKPGTIEKMGFGYGELSVLNPRLVYCSISGFGAVGAGRDLPGFDQSAQAMSGLMSVTGTNHTGPLRVGIAIGDSSAGVFAALGIVVALYERVQTGRGQLVETSLMESLLSLMSYQAQKWLSLGVIPPRDGNDHPLMFPQGTFQAADGPITLASGSEAMWRRLCEVIGAAELAEDERFHDNASRMHNRIELRKLLEARLRLRPAADWLETINAAGIPAAPIYTVEQALTSEIATDLDMVGEVTHPTLGELKVLGRPVKVGRRDGWLHSAPPLLGQDTFDICRDLGMSSNELEQLAAEGVLGAPERSTT
jgi:crotonobetainyl-CoA:carnitine CoA-transferase CaiB-like acyl-CoA transferase